MTIPIIESNFIFKKILKYCWKFDDNTKLFYWNRKYTHINNKHDCLKNKSICQSALQWKLNLMLVSTRFLSIILSNFKFSLQSCNTYRIGETHKPLQLSSNEISNLFENQMFNTLECFMTDLIYWYSDLGKESFVEKFSTIKKCIIEVDLDSLIDNQFFNVISNIGCGIRDNPSITLVFNIELYYANRKLIDNYKEIISKHKESYENSLSDRISLNIETFIIIINSETSNDARLMVILASLFDLTNKSIKKVYAFDQPHLTFVPYYIRDFKTVELVHLHSQFHDTYGRIIVNKVKASNELKDITFSIDYNSENEYGNLMFGDVDFYYSELDTSPTHISHLIETENFVLNDLLSGCKSNSPLESLSFKTNKLDLDFFKHTCKQTQSRPHYIQGNIIPIPSSLVNLTIIYRLNLKNEINKTREFEVFASFFNQETISNNLKYFNFILLLDEIKGYEIVQLNLSVNVDKLLGILFENGLKNVNSLEYISISFENKENTFLKKISSNLITNLLNGLNNTHLKGILFENIINLKELPIETNNFIQYPFTLNSNRSVYYYLK